MIAMDIERLPVLSDNYIFLLCDPERQTAAVVDPAVAAPVLARLEACGFSLSAIFNTHHHSDHVGGNRQLLHRFPDAIVYGGAQDRDRIPGQQVFLQAGDRVEFAGRQADVFFVPGHTRAHIAYYFPPVQPSAPGELFCGDTLFAGGCGRLFEGTPAQMVDSLRKLRQLPDNTRVWCAHEYTLKNYQFACTVLPEDARLRQRLTDVQTARQRSKATVPAALGLEKQTNLFLRWDDPVVQAAMGTSEDARTFARLRGKKDLF